MTISRVLLCAVAATLTIAGCGDNLEAPGPDTLTVDPTTVVLHVGESMQVTATYSKHGASLAGGDMKWSSSDPGRATVRGTSTSATITGVAAGAATITASGDGLTATVEVTISPATLAGIAITPPAPSLPAGTTKTVGVIATYSDGTTADVTASVTWVSAGPSIATVDGTTLSALVKGDTTITAMFMGRFSSTHVFVTDPLLRSIDVAPAAPAVVLGGTQQFTATGHFSDASTRDVTSMATWASSAATIATISNAAGSKGLATPLAVGPTTISATIGTVVGMTTLTVEPAALVSIDVTPAAPAVALGGTQQFTATGHFSDASTLDVTSMATWTSSAATIATISNAAGSNGLATTLAVGPTTISATIGTVVGMATLTVGPAALVSIDVAPAAPAVALGGTQQFTATGHFSDASTLDVTSAATWASAAATIATISNAAGSNGLATTLAVGPTTISATIGTVVGLATLTVQPAALVSIAVTPKTDLALTTDQQFTATGTFSDGSTLDLTATVTWSSSDSTVATIGATGLATALAVGPTTITAQRGTISGSVMVNVVLPDVGPWVAAPGFMGRPCNDAVKFSVPSSTVPEVVYVCTTANGVARGAIAADTSISFSTPNTGVTNLQGLSIAAHPTNPTTMMYMAVPTGTNNWFRSSDNATTFSAFSLLDSAGNPRYLYAGRLQPMVGNILGSWDPGTAGTPQAVVITGMNPPTGVHPVATATGIVHSIAGSAANNLYVAVLGQTPAGAPATGGVFRSIDATVTWTETDTGIAAADKDKVASLAIDPTNPLILYAGVRGGGLVYKTIDGGTTWTASAAGIPTRASVSVVYVSPNAATVFAATDRGLYKSIDGGTTWALAGFLGRSVLGIAQSSVAASLILAGVDDAVGLYRAQ